MSIRIIHIGVGGFGKSWRHTLTTTPDIEIAALVDFDRDNLKDAADFLGISEKRCITNPEEPWEEMDADILIDSTPQCNHLNHALRAFSGGKHLLVVKPMADKLDSAVTMVQESEKSGLKMVVAQQMRFHPTILKLREIVQNGTLGEIGYVQLDAYFSKDGFSGSYPQSYPLLVQGSIHHFDFLRWVLGEDTAYVWGDTWNPPWIDKNKGMRCAYVTFQMQSGCHVNYRAIATVTGSKSWLCEWRIEGTKGIATVSDDRIYLNDSEVELSWQDGSELSELKLDVLNKVVFERLLKYIEDDEEPKISGKNNLNSMEMVFGAIDSSQTGQRYSLQTLKR